MAGKEAQHREQETTQQTYPRKNPKSIKSDPMKKESQPDRMKRSSHRHSPGRSGRG
jgi:hypothetical protein